MIKILVVRNLKKSGNSIITTSKTSRNRSWTYRAVIHLTTIAQRRQIKEKLYWYKEMATDGF